MAATIVDGHNSGPAPEKQPSIPLVSIAPLLDPAAAPSSRHTTAKSLLSAFQDFGFLYLTDYSALLPPSLISAVFAQSAHFFALPIATKESLAWTTARANRGYTAMAREKVSNGMTQDAVNQQRDTEGGDLKESIEIGRENEPGHPNRWFADDHSQNITGAAEFKEIMNTFWAACKRTHQVLMQAIALGLDLEESFFDRFTVTGDNTLRLLHYPPVAPGGFEGGKRVRAGAHTDYGSITLLFQDERGGLQVEPPAVVGANNHNDINSGETSGSGTWIGVKPIPDTIVVNAGDLLSRWSNDLIRSTRHRVVEPPLLAPPSSQANGSGTENGVKDGGHPARYSVAYFANPDYDGWIEAIPGTYGGERGEKKYAGVNSGDYLEMRLSATHY